MSTTFPTTKQTFTNPNGADKLNSPSHSDQHADVNDTVEALEDKVGIGSSTPTTTTYLKGTAAGQSAWTAPLDEDDMASNSATDLATQQSIKAYVDNNASTAGEFGASTELTISGGVITRTQVYHEVDTESNDATDDLDTINGGSAGDLIIIRPTISTRTIVVKDGTGNIAAAGDFTMDHAQDMWMGIYSGANWNELSRSDNNT